MLHQLNNLNDASKEKISRSNVVKFRTSSGSLVTHLISDRTDLLKKFFQRKDDKPYEAKVVSMKYTKFHKSDQDLIERFGTIAFDKQINIAKVIGDNAWSLDMVNEKINFGNEIEFSFKILGSYSRTTNTWLWAWANTAVGHDEKSLLHANELKAYGEENDIEFLKLDSFEAINIDMHLIGLTASGLFKTTGYYIADYGAGAMVFTIQNDEINKFDDDELGRILTVFNQFIADFEIDQIRAFKFYLKEKGYDVVEEKNKIIGTKLEKVVSAEFDNKNSRIEIKA
ncbi:DUF6882 domain-containing protein [Pedobacter sp. Leaf170]|uniref:DUF6882 domain-containing protein n=1 Tax=Pedobacter sp. Leaf170 TaxID=2876558 RepID=UPI001E59356C|nr:DUF6882 domain-containing protein [Pedobacter sp. Leaf170]